MSEVQIFTISIFVLCLSLFVFKYFGAQSQEELGRWSLWQPTEESEDNHRASFCPLFEMFVFIRCCLLIPSVCTYPLTFPSQYSGSPKFCNSCAVRTFSQFTLCSLCPIHSLLLLLLLVSLAALCFVSMIILYVAQFLFFPLVTEMVDYPCQYLPPPPPLRNRLNVQWSTTQMTPWQLANAEAVTK